MYKFAAISALALAACAQAPEKVAPIPVAGDPYRGYSCSQLKAEQLKVNHAIEALSAEQKKAADNDALGVILLGLPISSMSGNDKEAALGVAKGRKQALEAKILARKCR